MEDSEKNNAEKTVPSSANVQQVDQATSVSPSSNKGRKVACEVHYRCMSDVVSKPIEWLWPGVLAKGKFSLISGFPGLGKSQVSLFLASIVSTGACLPASTETASIGNVIILSAEDDAADTIKPRLEAAGADMDKIFILDAVPDKTGKSSRMFSLKDDLNALSALVETVSDVSLIIIDPISAYTAGVDNYKDADLRQLLSPLTKFAEKYGVAVLGVAHLNKGGDGKMAITRTLGSMAFVGAARSVWYTIKDESDPERRLFAPAKNNIGKDDVGYAFRILPVVLADGITTSTVKWENGTYTVNLDHLMVSGSSGGSILDDAADFLKQILANGFMPSTDVFLEAEKAGFSRTSINRAKACVGIKPFKQSSGAWAWRLPERNSTCSDAPPEQDGHLDRLE